MQVRYRRSRSAEQESGLWKKVVYDAVIFTSFGGMPARAGLMRGYGKLIILYRVKEICHTIAEEEPHQPGRRKNSGDRIFFIFSSDG